MAEMGRPTKYSEELADFICELVREGKTLTVICELEQMPHRATIYDWLDRYEDFHDKYYKAQEQSSHAIYESGLKTLESTPTSSRWVDKYGKELTQEEVDFLTPQEKKQYGVENIGLSPALVTLNKEIFNAKKHFASIRNPDVYSDKRRIEMSGGQRVQYITKEEKSEANNAIEDIIGDEKA